MKIGSFSQMAEKCQKCPDKGDCDNKRMEACAYIIDDSCQPPFSHAAPNYATPNITPNIDTKEIEINIAAPAVADVIRQIERIAYRRTHCGLNDI